jgi:hypothetical protein
MQRYQDPDGLFAIEYPKAWKVQRAENGYTVFYRDDPEEGILVGLFPRLVLDGEATAAQIIEGLVQQVRKRYPDIEVRDQKVERDPEGGEFAVVDARWTNSRNERMKTLLFFHVNPPGNGRSVLALFNFQAPEVAFSAVEPTFQHMFKSLGR